MSTVLLLPRRVFAFALLTSAAFITYLSFEPTVGAQNSKNPENTENPIMMVGTISGRVFADFNGNGTFETSGGTAAAPTAVDAGVAGVTVSAYNSAGALSGTATTGANGIYNLSATGTGPYRIEFTNLPAGYSPSARSDDSVGSATATTAGSTVQFVPDGTTTDVNLAVNRPIDYCEDNPQICAQMYGMGSAGVDNAVFSVPYTAGSARVTGGLPVDDFTSPTMSSLANTDQVGTTFGIAYHRATRRVFVSAVMKKHTKFGPGGTGAIYQINRSTGALTEYVNLNTVFGAGTAGANPHNTADYNTDNGQTTWDAVGKISLGGIALSADEQYLFAMNLADRQLYRIPTSGALNSTTITRYAFPTAMPNTCDVSEVRPFAVTQHEGLLYVGAVCSRETITVIPTSANLRAYVFTFNPTTLTFNTTPVINAQLNYTRLETDPGLSAAWLNWRTTYNTISGSHFIYPQPMLTDIDFDRGNMIISLRDRNGDQTGYNNASNPGNTTQLFKGISAGDVLRACGSPSLGWTLESNARCATLGSGPQGSNEGPGGGEYYYQDNYHPNGTPHDEVGLGAAAQIPGHNVMVATVFDPVYLPNDNIYDAGGFRWFTNSTGAQNRGYLAYASGLFGKANGIGNVHPLCEAAPIQIGNRIWRDSNNNGVQDPGEPALAGVTVRLYQGSTLVGTAVTDANGEYYFVSATAIDANPGDNIGQVNGGILRNTAYQVRLDNPADYTLSGPLSGHTLTTANQSTQLGDADASDSDATLVTNPAGSPGGIFPVVPVTTGGAGSNNHTFDIGLRIAPTAASVTLEGRVVTSYGAGIRNVMVRLIESDGSSRAVMTSTFGNYRFNGLTAGQTVVVEVSAKRYSFKNPTRLINLSGDLTPVDFISNE